MSRKRSLSTDISIDPKMAALAEYGVLPLLLYTWAIPHADDYGRITADAVQFRLMVCPALDVTPRDVDDALDQIAAVGLWERGEKVIQFPAESWFKHQSYISGAKRPGAAQKQDTPEEQRETPRKGAKGREPAQNPASPSPSLSPSPSEEKDANANALAAAGPPPPVPVSLPSPKRPPAEERKVNLGQEAVACYQEHYSLAYGGRAVISDQDARLLKGVRSQVPDGEFCPAMDRYFACRHEVVCRNRHTIKKFAHEINVWLSDAAVAASYPPAASRASPRNGQGGTLEDSVARNLAAVTGVRR